MKKLRVVLIVLLALVLIAAAIWGVLTWRQAQQEAEAARLEAARLAAEEAAAAAAEAEVEQTHRAVYDRFARMMNAAADVALTVTEGGETVGTYTLADLGLLENARAQVMTRFDATSQMIPTEFAKWSRAEKAAWQPAYDDAPLALSVDEPDLTAVLADLEAMERTAPVDAEITFADGAYAVVPEVAGNTLREDAVETALTDALETLTLSPEGMPPVTVEIDQYEQPTVTTAELPAFADLLTQAQSAQTVTLDFLGTAETLTAEQLATLVTVDETGALIVDETTLTALVTDYAARYDRSNTPYRMDTYVEGIVPMHFLPVSYTLDQAALTETLRQTLTGLESIDLTAPFDCTREGKPFDLGDEYVEVDVKNQVMTYIKDGEVLVTTDIVTGSAWLSPTPEGLYAVDNMTTDTWLFGPDYTVYVDYWVGFISFYYGLHDAQWRTEFGGDNYIRSGSHGCVNTPSEAMATIYENITIGVPVLVHGPYR